MYNLTIVLVLNCTNTICTENFDAITLSIMCFFKVTIYRYTHNEKWEVWLLRAFIIAMSMKIFPRKEDGM